jgi:hypothetical protein
MWFTACGEEVPRPPPEEAEQRLSGHSCDLVSASELSQLFVGKLTPVRDTPAGNTACTWKAADSGDAVFRYEVRPYVEDLEAAVREFAAGHSGGPGDPGELNVEVRPGLGEAAVWTDIGLFVSRNGRTLQLTPFDEEIPRAIYEELASLLLERLEAGR